MSQPFTDNLASQTTDHLFFSRLSNAFEELLCASLVNRTGETAVLTVHHLVQSAARKLFAFHLQLRYHTIFPPSILLYFSQLLEEIVSISETFSEGEGQRARALYKLSVIHAERGMLPSSEACRGEALRLRAKLKPELKDDPFEEAEYAKLCLWMLW